MDPWISQREEEVGVNLASPSILPDILHNNINITGVASIPSTEEQNPVQQPDIIQQAFSFEDNFQPQESLPQSDLVREQPTPKPFTKLPDSHQYLQSLEKKLERIQSGSGGKKGSSSANSILKSLGETRESCMVKLLSNSAEDQEKSLEDYLSDEVKVNLLLKKIAPERQAISTEELIHLLKADQLELKLSAEAPDSSTQQQQQTKTEDPIQSPQNIQQDKSVE